MKKKKLDLIRDISFGILIIFTAIGSIVLFIADMRNNNTTKDYNYIENFSYIGVFILSVIMMYQNILSRSSSEEAIKTEKEIYNLDLINRTRISEIQDIVTRINQLYEKICNYNRELNDLSAQQNTVAIENISNANGIIYKVNQLMYDIKFFYSNDINMIIPASLENNYTMLSTLKTKVKETLEHTHNDLKSYHDYLANLQNINTNMVVHYSCPGTIPTSLFDKIYRINSEFHQKLHTVDPDLTFPS